MNSNSSFLSNKKIVKIECVNNVSFYEENRILEIKMNLFRILENQEENYMELQYLLNKINPSWRMETIKNSLAICEDIVRSNLSYMLPDEDCLKLLETCTTRDYNMEFFAFEHYVAEISKILIKVFSIVAGFYNFQDINDMCSMLSDKKKKSSNNTSMSNNSIEQGSFTKSMSPTKQTQPQTITQTSGLKIFPEGIKSLLETFSFIKTLKLFIPNNFFILDNFILFFANIPWLLPNLLQIDLDLETYLFAETNPRDTVIQERCELFFEHNKDKFLLLLLISYYVGKYDNLKTLKLKIPESFELEISKSLQAIDIELKNFHYLDFFNNLTSLFELTVEFNSLDSRVFERVIGLIHKNNWLKYLRINFFPENQEQYFTSANLLRLCKSQKFTKMSEDDLPVMSGTSIEEEQQRIALLESELDDNDYNLKLLKQQFQINIERLYFVLVSKLMTISELSFLIDFPHIIRTNDNYIRVFHKFLCNLFTTIEYINEQLQSLEIVCTNLPFDPVEFPILGDFLTNLSIKSNSKLINLKLNFEFSRVHQLERLFPSAIQDLELGELDTDSFISFVQVWKNAENEGFRNDFKSLHILKIYISSFKYSLSYGFKPINDFFWSKKPKSLKEVEFYSNLNLSKIQINSVLMGVNYDSVPSYIIKFSSQQHLKSKITISADDIYYTKTNKKLLYTLAYAMHLRDNRTLCSASFIENKEYIKNTLNLVGAFTRDVKKKNIDIVLIE